MAQLPPDQCPDLPREVDFYHELVPLDNPQVQLKSNIFGYVTSVYKATHCKSGIQYCLYRIHSYRLNNVKVTQIVDMWKKLQHSGLVQLREVFTTKVFGDNCES
ncbi:PAN2-PAN3 deadenylation complex subunit pan3-like [Hyalella azteca]|uniref:PAN2-PAN3 deadenylation complex subunit pan3-like n=1 Tax=Hyalella azteca TaxID=294128 RepID=A0A979FS13_HYAAZ|nr:PAN2-PAN3 deadenylation complex subunit pan3-like [Hyalella azteca]